MPLHLRDSQVKRQHLKEGEAASVAQVVAPALGEQEVVVHAGQALPRHQVKVELWFHIQVQLTHHGGKEGGVLLVESASPVLLRKIWKPVAAVAYDCK